MLCLLTYVIMCCLLRCAAHNKLRARSKGAGGMKSSVHLYKFVHITIESMIRIELHKQSTEIDKHTNEQTHINNDGERM